jgi:hypothetical protein
MKFEIFPPLQNDRMRAIIQRHCDTDLLEVCGTTKAEKFLHTIGGIGHAALHKPSRNQLCPLRNSYIFDSGATAHICNDPSRAIGEMRTPPQDMWVSTGSRQEPVIGIGEIFVYPTYKGKKEKLLLKEVLFAPTVTSNMVSWRRLRNAGIK